MKSNEANKNLNRKLKYMLDTRTEKEYRKNIVEGALNAQKFWNLFLHKHQEPIKIKSWEPLGTEMQKTEEELWQETLKDTQKIRQVADLKMTIETEGEEYQYWVEIKIARYLPKQGQAAIKKHQFDKFCNLYGDTNFVILFYRQDTNQYAVLFPQFVKGFEAKPFKTFGGKVCYMVDIDKMDWKYIGGLDEQ